MLSSYFDLNLFEWVIFILALILIAGLLCLVPLSKKIASLKYGTDGDSEQAKSE